MELVSTSQGGRNCGWTCRSNPFCRFKLLGFWAAFKWLLLRTNTLYEILSVEQQLLQTSKLVAAEIESCAGGANLISPHETASLALLAMEARNSTILAQEYLLFRPFGAEELMETKEAASITVHFVTFAVWFFPQFQQTTAHYKESCSSFGNPTHFPFWIHVHMNPDKYPSLYGRISQYHPVVPQNCLLSLSISIRYQYQNPLYYPVISNPPCDDTETMFSQGNHPQMALFQVFFGWWVILIQLELYFFSEMTMNNNGIC